MEESLAYENARTAGEFFLDDKVILLRVCVGLHQ